MNLTMDKFLIALIIVLLPVGVAGMNNIASLTMLLMLGLYLFKVLINGTYAKTSNINVMLLYALWSIILLFILSALNAPDLPTHQFDLLTGLLNPENNIYYSIISFIKAVVFAFVLSKLVSNNEQIVKILRFHVIVGTLFVIVGIFIYLSYLAGFNKSGIGLFTEWYVPRLKVLSIEPQAFAGYLMTIIPLLMLSITSKELFLFKPKTSLLMFCINMGGMFLTFSTGGFISFSIIFVTMLLVFLPLHKSLFSRKRFAIFSFELSFLGFSAIFFGYKYVQMIFSKFNSSNLNSSHGVRMLFWENALKMAQDNPVLGVGPGRYGYFFEYYNRAPSPEAYVQPPQNIILGFLANTGLISATLLMCVFLTIFLRLFINRGLTSKARVLSVSLSLILLSLFIQHQAFWLPYSYTLWFFIGICLAFINNSYAVKKDNL